MLILQIMNTVHLVVHIAQHHSLRLLVLCWWHWLALPGLTSDLPRLTVCARVDSV